MAGKMNITSPKMLSLVRNLFGSMNKDQQAALLAKRFAQPSGVEGVDDLVPTSLDAAIGNQEGALSAGQIGSVALGAAKAHPFKTAGLVGLGASNLGGLTDNDKFGGQLGGLALGGAGAYLAGASPYTAALMTLGGGALGNLFDKLRARREQEQAYRGR